MHCLYLLIHFFFFILIVMAFSMRIALLLVFVASATVPSVASGVHVTNSAQTCTSADRADGTCNSSDVGSDDEGRGAPCADKDAKCVEYAEQGACDENPAYMVHHCAATCDTCDEVLAAAGSAAPVCTDEDYRCQDWAGMGECDANPNYMKNGCRRSCLVCDGGSTQFGVKQNAGGNNDDKQRKTSARLDESFQYMRRVWSEEKFQGVRHKCKNQHEDCTFWASLGECEANPKYMKTDCAPACYTCDLLEISNRCPVLPDNPSIWKPGDLNSLMEAIVDNADGSGDYQKYNPTALSRPQLKRDGTPADGVTKDGPWVVLLENFVEEAEADRLVELGKQQGYERSSDVGKEKPDGSHDATVSDSRTSHNTWCQKTSCTEDPLVAPVIERVARVSKTNVTNSEYLQLLQYEPGQYYRQHHDYIPYHQNRPCGVRILTLFIYLNDVEEGGGTRFPLLDLTVQPKKGHAVLWPSVLDHAPETKDGRTDHEALPVTRGIKYGANAWIHNRDFKAAFKIDCH